MEDFDYIIVGSGSSGSVIANRLSEINNINICVLEAGGTNQHPYIKMPAGFIKTIIIVYLNFGVAFAVSNVQILKGNIIE